MADVPAAVCSTALCLHTAAHDPDHAPM